MLELEIIGDEEAIDALKGQIVASTGADVRRYGHRGTGGESGLAGILLSIVPDTLPSILGFVKGMVRPERDLKIIANGVELAVRDVHEASDVLDLLKSKGLLPEASDGG